MRRLGQHFLQSPAILSRIAAEARAASPGAGLMIEIGAGPGTLTRHLIEIGLPLLAVEIDPPLAATLRTRYPNIEVLESDILKVDLAAVIAARTPAKAVIAGNLPYYITSPILRRIFDAAGRITGAVLLVQKEVAARIVARPGTRDFGYLSVLCQAHSRPELLFSIAPGAFRPPPKVVSAVVRLTIEPRLEQWGVHDRKAFLEFVQLCFRQKRKTLLNNLQARFGRERAGQLPEARLRAEQIPLERFAQLWLSLRSDSVGPLNPSLSP